ncbi:MAG: NTP transferase domain-containing protein [Clostridia bacterium]|jgi:choline kinase/phosphatidylglycerophosphate synthase|nr:NTP transferase domain-containing protein [Clostridia bacterium]
MRAVILAAGEGSRLRAYSKRPKPLIPLLGLSLIERNMLALKECGINDIVIITGCYDNEIREYLGSGQQLGVKINYLHNPQWKLGNGTSAYTFQQEYRENEKYILMMADHIFEVELLRRFLKEAEKVKQNELLLASDSQLEKVYDLDECTKIKTDGNHAKILGKNLKDFNAVDCGLFLDTGVLQRTLSKTIEQGAYTLTDAVNLLAEEGKVKLHFVSHYWVDVDDKASHKYCETVLLRSLVPPKDGFISRTINRKFSLRITKLLASTKITPNQMTVFSFLIAALSAASFAMLSPLVGGLLAQLSSILDGVDGEIARLKFLKSRYGELFDSLLDRYADYLIVMGMSYAWFGATEHTTTALLVSAAALAGLPLSMLFKEKYRNLTGKPYLPEIHDGRLRYLPANRDGRLFIIMLGGILNQIPAALALLAAVTHLQTLFRLKAVRNFL